MKVGELLYQMSYFNLISLDTYKKAAVLVGQPFFLLVRYLVCSDNLFRIRQTFNQVFSFCGKNIATMSFDEF